MSRILGAFVLLAVLAVALSAYPLAAAAQAPAPKGTGAFAAVFKEDAVGQHNGNTWLLTYLATLIYPENLLESLGKSFAQDPQKDAQVIALNQRPRDFLLAFKKGTQHVFAGTPVLYAFVRGNKNFTLPVAGIVSGFEPEAGVISTPRAILVVIRGTDRDAAVKAGTLGYGYAEWIGSDFTAFGFAPALGLPGLPGQPGIAPVKVPGFAHAGFWLSLQAPTVYCEIVGAGDQPGPCPAPPTTAVRDSEFRERIFQLIRAFGGATKRVWITGHSLGAAQAQDLAMWLDARTNDQGQPQSVSVQGIRAIAAPHVGTVDFVLDLNRRFTPQRLQRFDFVNDPVTMLPPYALTYARAGTRVYYDDIKTMQFAVPERAVDDALALTGAVAGVLTDFTAGGITEQNKVIKLRPLASPFCYHYPHWYLSAAYSQLTRLERARVPNPLRLPDFSERFRPCGAAEVELGRRNVAGRAIDLAKDTAVGTAAAIETVAYDFNQLVRNATGRAVDEDTYRLRAVKGGKYLHVGNACADRDGCVLEVADPVAANTRFTVRKQGLGYVIQSAQRFVEVDANDLFENNARVQVWEPNALFGGHLSNQVWYFFRVKEPNAFVVVNEASGRVLDLRDACAAQSGCGVRQWAGRNNDPSQVWILEKVR
jgi:hypothetical protein